MDHHRYDGKIKNKVSSFSYGVFDSNDTLLLKRLAHARSNNGAKKVRDIRQWVGLLGIALKVADVKYK